MALPTSVLCPVDFSAHSERALRHALAIAGAFGAHVTVVTINDPMLVAGAEAAGYSESLRDQVEEALQETLGRMPAAASPLLPAIDIVTGAPATEILAAAERAGADLIVMGTRGLGGASRLMFGSTTERVVRAAHLPVLAVPEYTPERMSVEQGEARFTLNQVVAAIGLDATDTTVAATAGEWARACQVPLTLGHVCHDAPAPAWWPMSELPAAETVDDARRSSSNCSPATFPPRPRRPHRRAARQRAGRHRRHGARPQRRPARGVARRRAAWARRHRLPRDDRGRRADAHRRRRLIGA